MERLGLKSRAAKAVAGRREGTTPSRSVGACHSVRRLHVVPQTGLQQTPLGNCQPWHLTTTRSSPAAPMAILDYAASLSSLSTDEDVPLPNVDQKYLSDQRFDDFAISAQSKRALAEVLQYERCSIVQAASIPVCLGPEDVIAKAKTGTGKTLAFIIPTIEKVLANRAPAGKVSALVLSPTRELARQIQTETHKMLSFHSGLHSMVVYGGVDVKKHLRAMNQRMPDILIATPGRCWDIMTQTHDRALTSVLDSTRVLVLDEADNLLDMGFRPQISKILGALPPTARRQTFLFSATFPSDVKSLADVALKRQHSYVDAVGEDVATHTHVEASSLVVPKAQLPLQLLGLLAQHMAQEPDYKIMVFLPTAHLTAYFADLFRAAGLGGVLDIHSRKSQPKRDQASAEFRAGSRMVMFSSDVSARGVDYPNVSYVVQLGAPANREQYIHRAGRTGRAGRAGQSTLLLADFERPFLDRLRDLPISPLQPMATAEVAAATAALPGALSRDPAAALARAAGLMDATSRAKAYQSFLGFYKSHETIKLRSEQVVATANQYAADVLGCPTPPGLLAKTVGKMGLKGVPGLVIVKEMGGAAAPAAGGGRGPQRGGGGGGGNGGGGYEARGPPRSGGGGGYDAGEPAARGGRAAVRGGADADADVFQRQEPPQKRQRQEWQQQEEGEREEWGRGFDALGRVPIGKS
ncbi:hypothetical protein PLESTM_001723500 [Pleodorina starrii]|nr:hypothetical protein PLESTM_001723500 [Pleodorina starrii]